MSTHKVEVIRLGPVTKHENADSLGVTKVFGGYPAVVRLSDFKEGDLAAYVIPDSMCPVDKPEFEFLKDKAKSDGKARIRAAKLRGVVSMGLLVKARPNWKEGDDVAEELGVTHWEPPIQYTTGGEDEAAPGFIPVYTDIENYRRYPDVLKEGEEVVVTEKLHGASGRWAWDGTRLWVGSHRNIKRFNINTMWWKVAIETMLDKKLVKVPNIVFYGEVYGKVQSLKYGLPNGLAYAMFDAFDVKEGKYVDRDIFTAMCREYDLNMVPELFRGPWSKELVRFAEGNSTVPGADHIREGFVAKPVKERFDDTVGRVILKVIGEKYLLT